MDWLALGKAALATLGFVVIAYGGAVILAGRPLGGGRPDDPPPSGDTPQE